MENKKATEKKATEKKAKFNNETTYNKVWSLIKVFGYENTDLRPDGNEGHMIGVFADRFHAKKRSEIWVSPKRIKMFVGLDTDIYKKYGKIIDKYADKDYRFNAVERHVSVDLVTFEKMCKEMQAVTEKKATEKKPRTKDKKSATESSVA